MLTTIWMPVSSLLVDTPPVHRHRRLIHLHKDFPNSNYKPVVGRNHFVKYQLVKRDAGRASVAAARGKRVRHATGRRVTGLASRQHPEYGATSQPAPATEYSSTSSTDDHQGEAARLSRVCRGLGLTVDAPRLRQAARRNYATLISWTGQIIAADGNPSGGVQFCHPSAGYRAAVG